MKFTTFERLLRTERLRRQMGLSSSSSLAVPSLKERPLEVGLSPLLVTNMRGGFVKTHSSEKTGLARYGFSECTTADEVSLFRVFLESLLRLPWVLKSTTFRGAISKISQQGLIPRTVVIPYTSKIEGLDLGLSLEEADHLMVKQGYVAELEGLQVLMADIPETIALVAAAPVQTGFYTRVDDRLGIMITQADKSICVVNHPLGNSRVV